MDLHAEQSRALANPATDPAEVLNGPRWTTELPGGNILSVVLAVDR
jgi:hypothetical protein